MSTKEGHLVGGTHLYIKSVFDPAEYELTKTEAETLLALVPALKAIDELYFLQRGGEYNLEVWERLTRAADRSDNPRIKEYQRQVSIYGWPYDSSGNKIKPSFTEEEWLKANKVRSRDVISEYTFVGEETAEKGADVFVNETDMSDEAFAEWMKIKFNEVYESLSEVERSARTHPLLNIGTRVVVSGSEGKYKILDEPWPLLEQELTLTAAKSFWEAGKKTAEEFPKYSAMLKGTGRGMLTNNFDLRDALLPSNDSRLYTLGGITEEYIGASLGWSFVKKGAYDLIVGVQNPELTELIEKTKSKLPELVATLPKDLRNKSITPITMHGVDTAIIAGDGYHKGYTMIAKNWPNDELLNSLYPYIAFFVKERNAGFKYVVKPSAKALLPEDKIPEDDKLYDYGSSVIIIHEFDHSVGEKNLYDPSLEEGKATAGALWHYPIFEKDNKKIEEYCWRFLPKLIRTIRMGSDLKTGIVNASHAVGENTLFEKMLENSAVEVDSGIVEIDSQTMRDTASKFFVDAVRLEYEGTQKEIDQYLEPYRKLSETTRGLVERLDEINLPKSFFVDRGTVDEFEARLRNHLKSLT